MEEQAVEIVKAYQAAYHEVETFAVIEGEKTFAYTLQPSEAHAAALRAMELAAQYSLNLD